MFHIIAAEAEVNILRVPLDELIIGTIAFGSDSIKEFLAAHRCLAVADIARLMIPIINYALLDIFHWMILT